MRVSTKSQWALMMSMLSLFGILVVNSLKSPIQASTPTLLTSTNAPSYILNIEYQGGLCQYGACHEYTTIYKDGSVVRSDVPGVEVKGHLDSATIDDLTLLIETSEFASLRAVKFTGECPTAYGGQETIYTFYRSSGPEVISDCQFVIDYTVPLFSKINELLPRIGTPVPHYAPPTVTPSITPTLLAANPLEALLQKMASRSNCFRSHIEFKQDGKLTIYTLHCQIAAAESVDVSLEQFDTEADAQQAFKPVPGARMVSFHDFPAATAIPIKSDEQSTEYMVIQAKRLLITIYSRFDNSYGVHAVDAAESLYQVSGNLGLAFQATPIPSSTPTPMS